MDGRVDVIRLLESGEIHIPVDGLTVEKIKDRAEAWQIEDDSFRFRIERHENPFRGYFKSESGAMAVRRNVGTEYRYNRTTEEWMKKVLNSEYRIDTHLLIRLEFERAHSEVTWEPKTNRVQNADNPEKVLDEEFEPVAEKYRDQLCNPPEVTVEEVLAILKDRLRKEVG